MLRRPPSSPIIAIAKPSPSAPSRLATGTRQSSKMTIAVDHPGRHVVDREIGGGRGASGGQFLEDQRGIEPREAAAAELIPDIDPGKAERRRLAQSLDRKFLPCVPARRVWEPFVAGEL